jgi:hypothetical protein
VGYLLPEHKKSQGESTFKIIRMPSARVFMPCVNGTPHPQTQKTPSQRSRDGVFDKTAENQEDRLFSGALGRFKRVDLLGRFGHARVDMGGQVAIAVPPLDGGLRAGGTIPARSDLDGAVASFALLHDFITHTTMVSAALGCHEGTLIAFTNRCTFHGNTSQYDLNNKKAKSERCLRPFQKSTLYIQVS